MSGFDVLIGFLSTLFATLIGVAVAFWNDRKIEQRNQYNRTIQHLQSVNKELDRNREAINHTIDVITKLQDDQGGNSSHYAVDLLSTDAWSAALDDGIIESVDRDLYEKLNEVYYRTNSINELVRRLRTESLHPSLGESKDTGVLETEIWTITVTYWNEEEETIQEAELATVLKSKSNSLGIRIDGVSDRISSSIEELEEKKEDVENMTLTRLTNRRP